MGWATSTRGRRRRTYPNRHPPPTPRGKGGTHPQLVASRVCTYYSLEWSRLIKYLPSGEDGHRCWGSLPPRLGSIQWYPHRMTAGTNARIPGMVNFLSSSLPRRTSREWIPVTKYPEGAVGESATRASVDTMERAYLTISHPTISIFIHECHPFAVS